MRSVGSITSSDRTISGSSPPQQPAHLGAEPIHIGGDDPRLRKHGLPDFRQPRLLGRGAVEKLYAELRLQIGYGVTHDGGSPAELAGGRGEASCLNNGDKNR
jgi:hypothetical protein